MASNKDFLVHSGRINGIAVRNLMVDERPLDNLPVTYCEVFIDTTETTTRSEEGSDETEMDIISTKIATSDFAWYTANPTWAVESLANVVEHIGEKMHVRIEVKVLENPPQAITSNAVFERPQPSPSDPTLCSFTLEVAKLKFVGAPLDSIESLPANSVFFLSRDGFIVSFHLYMALRKAQLISASEKGSIDLTATSSLEGRDSESDEEGKGFGRRDRTEQQQEDYERAVERLGQNLDDQSRWGARYRTYATNLRYQQKERELRLAEKVLRREEDLLREERRRLMHLIAHLKGEDLLEEEEEERKGGEDEEEEDTEARVEGESNNRRNKASSSSSRSSTEGRGEGGDGEDEDLWFLESEVMALRKGLGLITPLPADPETEVERAKQIKKISHERSKAYEKLLRMKFLMDARRVRLLSDLRAIFPIGRSPSSDGMTICGLELPRDANTRDEESVSTALGHVAHLLLLLSKYLDVPLRYQIHYQSSRSTISDSVMPHNNGTLFRRESKRLDQGVLMLTRNVRHLMNCRGMEYATEAHYLVNLMRLLETETLVDWGK